MERHDRSSYPDAPHPDDGHRSVWIAKPYSIVITAVVLFIIIFGIALFLGWRQLETTRHNALTADKTTANLTADLIQEHNRATIGILQSYAHRPLFIAAAKNKDIKGVYRHLSGLKKNAEINLTFVTDSRGILWANFPVFPEAIGKNLSNRDWYKGTSSHWKPYISIVFKLIVGDKPLAVAICVPIFDEKERVIGILASSQRLDFLVDTIQRVPFSPYTTMNVIDRAGKILYSNKFPYQENITDYRFNQILEPALKGKKQQIEMNDPQKDQEKSYLTVVPVGDIGWTVVIERSLRDIYRSEFRRFIELGAISFLLFLLITFFLVYLRKVSLFRKTEELLQAEVKLLQGEEALRALSSRQEAILAAVPEIIMEVDNNRVYTWANSVGIEFFGEDVIGKEAAFYFEGEQDTYDTVNPLFNGAEDIIYLESWQQRRDGEKRLLAWWCRVLKDEDGNVTGTLSSARDITERKREEEALRKSEERLRDIMFSMADWVWEVDENGVYTYSSQKGFDLFGGSRGDIIGKTPFDFMPPDEAKRVAAIFSEIVANKAPIKDLENWNISRNGGSICLLTNGVPILDKEGNLKGYRGVDKDITERKRAAEALRESEEKYRELVKNAPAGIYEVDYETNRFTSVNDVICEYTGYTRDELLTMNLFNLFTEESQKLMLARLEKLMAGEKTETTVEYCIRTKNGNELWALINARYIYEAGQLKGATGIIYNITDRRKVAEALRESEIKYRALIETTQTGFVIIDQDGLVLDANPEYVRLTGHHDLSEIVGRSVIEGTADHEKEKNAAAVGECFKKGYIRNLEIAYVDSKGSFTPIEINAIYMELEGVAQILTLCRDITQRKRAEEKLLQTLESIRRAVGTTVQVMVSAVEIRDPYTSGHQLRSADLARAIATEMGLPQEKIDGIRMAGSIHDIGKLSIPAEILSKPTKLTNLEFSLIKEHSRSGYEMLKDVESPWPLAQIVYQHHEGWMVQAIQEI